MFVENQSQNVDNKNVNVVLNGLETRQAEKCDVHSFGAVILITATGYLPYHLMLCYSLFFHCFKMLLDHGNNSIQKFKFNPLLAHLLYGLCRKELDQTITLEEARNYNWLTNQLTHL